MKRYANNTMLCWNPGTDQVELVPWPDKEGRSRKYVGSTLACFTNFREKNFEERKAFIYCESIVLIFRDKCDPAAVHKALKGLKEYIHGLPNDMLTTEEMCIRNQEEADCIES